MWILSAKLGFFWVRQLPYMQMWSRFDNVSLKPLQNHQWNMSTEHLKILIQIFGWLNDLDVISHGDFPHELIRKMPREWGSDLARPHHHYTNKWLVYDHQLVCIPNKKPRIKLTSVFGIWILVNRIMCVRPTWDDPHWQKIFFRGLPLTTNPRNIGNVWREKSTGKPHIWG